MTCVLAPRTSAALFSSTNVTFLTGKAQQWQPASLMLANERSQHLSSHAVCGHRAQIQTIRQFITNEYAHSGIRDDGAVIVDKLLAFTRGVSPVF